MNWLLSNSGSEGETIGMDLMTMLMDMSLASILRFQDTALPQPSEGMVARLLQEALNLP